MRARGVQSPDWADMLVYLFAPEPKPFFLANTVTYGREPEVSPATGSSMPVRQTIGMQDDNGLLILRR